MAVPKKRTAKSKRNHRRSHHGATTQQLVSCQRCKEAVPSHLACPNCGTYKEREVIDVLKKLEKKERKEKEAALQEQAENEKGHTH